MIFNRYVFNHESKRWEDTKPDDKEIGCGIEWDLFEWIITAFLEIHPEKENGRFHHILSDGNLEYHWIAAALKEAATDRLYDYDYINMKDDPAFVLLYGMSAIYDALGLMDTQNA